MADDYEQLQRKLEEGLRAIRELKRLKAEEQRKTRPRLRLIKGSAIGAAVWAAVEWVRGGRRIAAALVATGITITGATIAEDPGLPGADPPRQTIPRPPPTEPTKRPTVRPSTALTPRSTSPPRTQVPMRVSPPAEPVTTKPVVKPTVKPSPVKPPPTTKPPKTTPVVSLPVAPAAEVPVAVSSSTPCTVNLLGVKLCLPLG